MLTSLGLENFKSWGSAGVPMAPITGFFGANSSGKTSLIQSILLLKQTADSSDRQQVLEFGDEGSLVRLGSFRDTIYRHDPKRELAIELGWRLPRSLRVTDPAPPRTAVVSATEIVFRARTFENGSGRVVLRDFRYQLNEHAFGLRRNGSRYELFSESPSFEFRRARGRPSESMQPVKGYGFPDEVRASFQNAGFVADLELAFEAALSRVFYLGPLRENPKPQYPWAGSQPADMGRRGERVIEAILAARARNQTISGGKGRPRQTLEEYVARWLRKLGLIHEFRVEEVATGISLYRVKVRKQPLAPEVLLTDVGFGISQVLPVIALCFYVPEGSTVIFEQPELHLHPSVQAGLADVFIDAVRRRNVQVVFESHSEHLLRRLQRRIAEEQLAITEAALYFCESRGGASTLVPLKLDDFGNIANWPTDFFGDDFAELAAMTRAAVERHERQAAAH